VELSQSEQQRLAQLSDDAKKMRERIQALEAILDAEHPNWRDR
jgi:phage shock protein B